MNESEKKYLDQLASKAQFLMSKNLPWKSEIGYFIGLNSLEIAESVFPEEFKALKSIQDRIVEKLDNHYLVRKLKSEE